MLSQFSIVRSGHPKFVLSGDSGDPLYHYKSKLPGAVVIPVPGKDMLKRLLARVCIRCLAVEMSSLIT